MNQARGLQAHAPAAGDDHGERLLVRDFVLVCVSNFLAFFSIYMIIPVLPVFLEDRGYSNALIGAIMSMATVAALLRPMLGRAADRHGRKLVFAWGTALLGASTFLYAAFGSALPLFIIRFLNGLGLAAFHTAAYAMVGDLAPPRRRLQAIALFYISVDVTIALAPLAAEAMKESWGFTPLYLVAGSVAVLSFLSTLIIRESGAQGEGTGPGRERHARITSLQRAIYTAVLGFTMTFGALQTFIVLSSLEHGIEQGELFFTVFAATLIVFRLGVGKRADRISRRPLILFSAFVTLAGLIVLAFSANLALLILGSFIYAVGFAYLPTTLSALLLDHTPPDSRGLALGIFMAVFDGGIGLGGIALGPLADLWGYAAMYVTSGCLAAAGLLYFYARTSGRLEASAEKAGVEG
ncbi:MAG: MFS transporter [Actinobacteria bacterium]|nr:MFS transporter [Actinomycetota bacterium]